MTTIGQDGCVEFWFFRRDAHDVRIVGDFDASGETGVAMAGGADGWWRAKVPLAAGEYRFRYVADGVWYTDYASNGIEVSKVGVNSVLVVPQARPHAAADDAGRMVA